MDITRNILDAPPPADVEAERLLLSAAIISNRDERNQMLRSVSADDFHDPFHDWVFRAMRANPTAEFEEILRAVCSTTAPSWIEQKRGFYLAEMIVRRDGHDHCGIVKHWRAYRDRVKDASTARKERDNAILRIIRVQTEWEATHGGTAGAFYAGTS